MKDLEKVKKLSIKQRSLILWISVTIIMLILLIFWFYSLRLSLIGGPQRTERPLLDIQQIRQDITTDLQKIEKGSQFLEKISTSSPTTPEELELQEHNQIKLEELRQKLEQLSNSVTE